MVKKVKISEVQRDWNGRHSQIEDWLRLKLLYLPKINQQTKTGFF